jgi:uncharacterized membrane protein YfcA
MHLLDNIELSLLLILSSAVTSFITAAMGIGGGVLLLAILASVLPPAALIPVHGLVQLGSNGHRAWMTKQHTDWTMVKFFSIGALLGALCASFIVIQLPLVLIQLSVAFFILYLIWGPKPKQQQMGNKGYLLAGLGTTLISMFVGATGPLVAGFVHRQSYDKFTTTSTFATCMSLQHLLKILVFTFVGFAFWEWLPLAILMILGGIFGTWLGLKMLHKIPTKYFSNIFRVVITLLAIRLLWQAVESLL